MLQSKEDKNRNLIDIIELIFNIIVFKSTHILYECGNLALKEFIRDITTKLEKINLDKEKDFLNKNIIPILTK